MVDLAEKLMAANNWTFNFEIVDDYNQSVGEYLVKKNIISFSFLLTIFKIIYKYNYLYRLFYKYIKR